MLDLAAIPDYQSSSDEEEDVPCEQEHIKESVQGAQAYRQSLDYIEDFYSKLKQPPKSGREDDCVVEEVSDGEPMIIRAPDDGSIGDRTDESLGDLLYSGVERNRRRKRRSSGKLDNSA